MSGDLITITPARFMESFNAYVTLEERHTDKVTKTRHPVEYGANTSDHAYSEPAQLSMQIGWTNSSEQAQGDETYVSWVYGLLVQLQKTLQPFSVQTGKRLYKNMLMTSLGVVTDNKTEATLLVAVELEEMIFASTTSSSGSADDDMTASPSSDPDDQQDPQQTDPPVSRGLVATTPVGAITSAISMAQGIVSNVQSAIANPLGAISGALGSVNIPLLSQAQSLTTTLNGVAYNMGLNFRDTSGIVGAIGDVTGAVTDAGGWFMDMADQTGNPLIQGMPVIPGVNMLEQYAHVGVGGALQTVVNDVNTAEATYGNLGAAAKMFFTPDAS